MGADCFHIWCDFPFLNKERGTVLDLNHCCSAGIFGTSELVVPSGAGLLQSQDKEPSKAWLCCRAPCASPRARACRRQIWATKGSFLLMGGSFLQHGHEVSWQAIKCQMRLAALGQIFEKVTPQKREADDTSPPVISQRPFINHQERFGNQFLTNHTLHFLGKARRKLGRYWGKIDIGKNVLIFI